MPHLTNTHVDKSLGLTWHEHVHLEVALMRSIRQTEQGLEIYRNASRQVDMSDAIAGLEVELQELRTLLMKVQG